MDPLGSKGIEYLIGLTIRKLRGRFLNSEQVLPEIIKGIRIIRIVARNELRGSGLKIYICEPKYYLRD